MKKVILCVLGGLLLLIATAIAEDTCAHKNILECSVLSEWKDYGTGHRWEETRLCVCDDCGKKITNTSYGHFEGHAFHLSESIHFEDENRHLFVFICPTCWHIVREEIVCPGGNVCLMVKPSVGEIPPVQQGESLEEQRLLTDEDYIKRWIAQDRADKTQ